MGKKCPCRNLLTKQARNDLSGFFIAFLGVSLHDELKNAKNTFLEKKKELRLGLRTPKKVRTCIHTPHLFASSSLSAPCS
jgi:hypothetical protein